MRAKHSSGIGIAHDATRASNARCNARKTCLVFLQLWSLCTFEKKREKRKNIIQPKVLRVMNETLSLEVFVRAVLSCVRKSTQKTRRIGSLPVAHSFDIVALVVR